MVCVLLTILSHIGKHFNVNECSWKYICANKKSSKDIGYSTNWHCSFRDHTETMGQGLSMTKVISSTLLSISMYQVSLIYAL